MVFLVCFSSPARADNLKANRKPVRRQRLRPSVLALGILAADVNQLFGDVRKSVESLLLVRRMKARLLLLGRVEALLQGVDLL